MFAMSPVDNPGRPSVRIGNMEKERQDVGEFMAIKKRGKLAAQKAASNQAAAALA